MTDTPNPTKYSANSNKANKPAETVRIVNQVTSGPVIQKKKSLGTKFRESFTGDDATSVGQYLLFDVIVPSVKNLIFNMIVEGGRRTLFGGGGQPTSSNPIIGQGTQYAKMFSGGGSTVLSGGSSGSTITKPRSTFDYKEVIVSTRLEAEEVIDSLTALVDEYQNATVADLYACVGVTPDHTAIKWGWTDVSQATIHPMQNGYLISMPQVKSLA